ncbi:hypothetical protein ACFOD4_04600 [Pseudoroseomonas globiformis]|uniref:Uncharacterized protein n=1 Tax=Teichococcus globiformis TaxID=2307229 RepID=A0ABV7G1Z0_9PROT
MPLPAHEQLFEGRQQRCALTGEWLIFAKRNGQNYYLCLGIHGEDTSIHRQIVTGGCLEEFPFHHDIIDITAERNA